MQAMIKDVSSVLVLVDDVKKAAKWYHDKLGFEIVSMQGHWVAVKPQNASTALHLCAKCKE